VMLRTATLLAKDTAARAALYVAYSSSRPLGAAPAGMPNHVSYTPVCLDTLNIDFQQCLAELSGGTGVTRVVP
jgi:hypothetical protein